MLTMTSGTAWYKQADQKLILTNAFYCNYHIWQWFQRLEFNDVK